ncbi:MAG: beta strand repeat-containing protein, partial [Gemmatimonadales bacterium]
MRDSATPTRDAPLLRLAFLGLVFVAAIVSCGKDLTGPTARFMRGLSWNAVFPPALRNVGGTSSGVVAFNRVHVVLHHSDNTVALDTVIAFPSGADSLTVSLTVELLTDAPAGGEPMTLNLGYLNAAGDTVFKGGPISITAAPRPSGGGVNPPVQISVAYTGPGASATAVVIAPRTTTVAGGAGFTFTAIATDAAGDTLAGTPVIWTSLDPTIATITAPAAGTGVALNVRGTARILAQLLTGATDTAQLVVTLPASQLIKSSGDAQTGTATLALAQPIVAKVAASDGVGIAGTTVTFAVASGGGAITPSAVTDVNGLATANWTLGATVGAQSVTATAGTLTGSPLTFTATAGSSGAGLRTWTGATNGAWATASNWSPAIVPGAGDSVFVPLTSTLPTLASATTIKSLTLASSAALTLTSGSLTLTGSLDATGGVVGTGSVALNSATAATVKGTVTTPVTVAGLYTVTGTFAASGMQLTNSGSVDVNGQTVAISGGLSTASTATIVMTQAAGILGITGSASFGGGDETGKLTAGTLSVGGNFSEGGGNAAAFNAGPAFTLLLSASAATTLSIANAPTSPVGNLQIANTAGVTALTAFVANDVTIATGALTGSAGATINGTLLDQSAHWAAGSITFNSSTPVSAGTPTISPAGQITFNANPTNLAGNLVVNGAVNVPGNLTINGHTLTVNGTLTTSGSGQLTMNNASDIVNVTGNIIFGSTGPGGTMSAGTVNLAGNFTQSGGAQSFSPSGTNTIVLNGVLVQGVTIGSPDVNYTASCASSCFQNFTIAKPSGTVTFTSAVKVLGNFVNSGGTAIIAPATNGAFIVAGNATFGPASTLHHVGVGTSTYSKGAGTTIDSVSYFGAGQTYNPATLGEGYSDIRGTANWISLGTLTGQMVLSGAGQLNVATSVTITGNFTSSGTATLKMTGLQDTLVIGGNATFGGGPTTGLLTSGLLDVKGNFSVATGTMFDASGSHTTQFSGSGTQTIGWTTPVANVGFNNVLFSHSWPRQFTSDAYIGGTVQIFSNDTTSQQSGTAFVSGAHRVTLAGTNTGVLDQSIGGAWRVGATNFALPGPSLATTAFTSLSNTDTTIFSGGGTVTVPPGSASKFVLLTKNVVLDNSTNLNLNGGLLNT